jgi:hypothetical protein
MLMILPARCVFHLPRGVFGAQEGAGEIGLQYPLPGREVELHDRNALADRGIVDKNV